MYPRNVSPKSTKANLVLLIDFFGRSCMQFSLLVLHNSLVYDFRWVFLNFHQFRVSVSKGLVGHRGLHHKHIGLNPKQQVFDFRVVGGILQGNLFNPSNIGPHILEFIPEVLMLIQPFEKSPAINSHSPDEQNEE